MDFTSFYRGAKAAESSGNPNAVNSITGAAGLFQFMPQTWAGVVRQYGERYGIRPDGIMDPEQQQRAIQAITENEYAPVVQRAGLQPTPENLYLVHLLGAPTFRALASADPSAPAASVIRNWTNAAGRGVFDANRGVFRDPNVTVAQALDAARGYYTRKAGGSPPPPGRPRQPVSPVAVPVQTPSPPPEASTQPPTVQASWISRLIWAAKSLFQTNPKAY
jgi:hypothetical protein